mmetsp:Transcript_15614/g.52719  ORF Transcript_15614/g.52719 Transcript_15614/m.52719 type:complete len:80 (-) Transcript_15614:629-868(-)
MTKAKADPKPESAADKKEPKAIKKKVKHGAGADANNDGHTTRAEAHAANVTVTPEDLNDDGRVTRSEARALRAAKRLAR